PNPVYLRLPRGVRFAVARTLVRHGELAVGGYGELQQVSLALSAGLEIRDHLFIGVYLFRRAECEMSLPDVLDAGRFAQGFENARRSAFARTIVHHRDLGLNGPDELRGVGAVQAVVRGLVNIHFADQVLRADKSLLVIPGEVAHIHKSESAVLDQNADAHVVIGIGFGCVLVEVGAGGVRLAGSRHRFANRFARGDEHGDVDSFQRNRIAGFQDAAVPRGLFLIRLVRGRDIRARDLYRLTVIQIFAD